MKTLFVENIEPGVTPPRTVETFQIASADRKNTKRGSGYLSMVLRDRTGSVDAKYWDVPDDVVVTAGQFVVANFTAESYKDKPQLKVHGLRVANRSEIDIGDYIPTSKRDRKMMFSDAIDVAQTVENNALHLSLLALLYQVQDKLTDAPAAKSLHQAYMGGLLEHILALCKLVDAVCACYPDLNRDVMIAGAIVHDIGKIEELCYQDYIGYTRAGSLTGHIVQGSILWSKYGGNLDPATRDHIQHIIASHHGRKEWGAAQVPMTREAHIFHLLDMIDSRIEIIGNALATGVDAEGMTSYDHSLECRLWNGEAQAPEPKLAQNASGEAGTDS